jgi:hypothetical protein
MKIGHTHCRRGKKVIVFLRDGTRLLRRYGEHRDKYVTFLDGPPIALKRIRTVADYRP